ncbi:MAG: DUF362 domain-containing protein [Myxococcota bacterium]
MLASILTSADLRYPSADESFSPSERFPEYPFDHVATRPNAVYAAVRTLFAQAGLDAEHFGTSRWNPLGEFIAPGSRVFVLCNFVYHRRPQDSERDFQAKCIHASVLRALCDYALIAVGPEGRIRFGNSPLQSTDWRGVLAETGATAMLDFYRKQGSPVEARDLRLFVVERTALGRVTHTEERDTEADAVEIALGADSLLSEIAGDPSRPARFRVSDYRPERIEAFHSGNRHRYVVHRELLEADTVISLPKLKTHEKVGITCGIKGFVGMVGHKDCLAHHRYGPPELGGDEHPPGLRFLSPVSAFQDWVQGRDLEAPLQGLMQIVDRTGRRILRRLGADMAGAWHGNDTCWRMALDLTQIAHYGGVDGRMHPERQRRHLCLIDGIVAGERDGPLIPRPVDAGTLLFSDSVIEADRAACLLMGFEPERIPMLREALRDTHHPLRGPETPRIWCNGERVEPQAIRPALGRAFRPPRGWKRHLQPENR